MKSEVNLNKIHDQMQLHHSHQSIISCEFVLPHSYLTDNILSSVRARSFHSIRFRHQSPSPRVQL